METPKTEEGEDEEPPLLFCKESQFCWNTVESEFYAAETTRTKVGRVQTKTVCCYYYSDGKLADDEYIDERRDDEKKEGAKTNKLQEAKGKRKKKGAQRAAVRAKRAKKS